MDRNTVQKNNVLDSKAEIANLNHTIIFAILIWSLGIGSLFYTQERHFAHDTTEMLYSEALSNFNKDQSLRFWATSHGGIYVPISEKTPPNPHLSHIPERDVTTPSGRQLTLMNPAYILRQVIKDHTELFGGKGHITSLKPINPDNAPDEWEREALKAFEEGAEEVTEVTEIDGVPYFRFMRSMITRKGCLKCHADQGYKVGEIRGGVSVSVEMAPYLEHEAWEVRLRALIDSAIWLLGVMGLLIGRKRILRAISSRQRSQQGLQESEEKFRGISDSAQDAIVLLDREGGICYWNRAAEQIFGYSSDEIIGQNFHQMVVPEHYRKAHEEGWSRFLETGEGAVVGKTIEVTALRRDGREFPVELSVSAIKLQGQWRAAGIIRDISERVSVERDMADISDKIVQAHREWVDAFDSMHTPIFLHDADGLVTRANQAYADRAEMEIRELIGKPYWECFPKREGPISSCKIFMGGQDIEELHKELNEEIVLDSGETFLSRATAITDIDGNYRYSIHIMEDITFERQAKESLEESERRFRKLFQHAPLAYQALNSEGDIVEVNSAWCELFGYKRKEVLNQPFTNFLPDSQQKQFLKRLAKLYMAKGKHAIELEICRQNGESRLISFEGRVSYNTDGEVERIHFILTDITEYREMVDTLRDSEERFRKIFDGTLDGILVANAEDKKFYMANQKICQMLGYTLEELEQMGIMDIHPVESVDYVIEQFERQRRGEIDVVENLPVKRKDDSIFYADITASPITINNRQYQIGIFRDTTERKIAEDSQSVLNEMLETSRDCNEVLVRATEEPDLIQRICNILAAHGDFSMVWVGLTDDDGQISDVTTASVSQVSDESCYDVDQIAELNASWKSEDGPCPSTEAMTSAAIQIIHGDDGDPTYKRYREKIAENGCLSLVALPLLHHDTSLGVILVYSYKSNVFSQQQINMLNELVYDLAYGIASLRLHKDRNQMGLRLENNLLQTVRVIARTLETRDPYTAGHQRRVTELSIAIAREMGFDEQRIEGIRFGATIHDIGKIHIPAEILNRPGRLTEMEFGIIKTHAEVGYEIVQEIDFPWPVSDIIYQHHERIDGSGYPQGLKGDEIILEAKIVAVADVVEAMSSHRPYRPGLGIDLALEEIEKHRGEFYDAEVVDTCVNLFRNSLFSFSS